MKNLHQIENEFKIAISQLEQEEVAINDIQSPLNKSAEDGRPHVEISRNEYSYVVFERGCELERRQTKDFDELMFWLISDMTFELASSWELDHRLANQDPRRLIFFKQLELMNKINTHWSEKLSEAQHEILVNYPFEDFS